MFLQEKWTALTYVPGLPNVDTKVSIVKASSNTPLNADLLMNYFQ